MTKEITSIDELLTHFTGLLTSRKGIIAKFDLGITQAQSGALNSSDDFLNFYAGLNRSRFPKDELGHRIPLPIFEWEGPILYELPMSSGRYVTSELVEAYENSQKNLPGFPSSFQMGQLLYFEAKKAVRAGDEASFKVLAEAMLYVVVNSNERGVNKLEKSLKEVKDMKDLPVSSQPLKKVLTMIYFASFLEGADTYNNLFARINSIPADSTDCYRRMFKDNLLLKTHYLEALAEAGYHSPEEFCETYDRVSAPIHALGDVTVGTLVVNARNSTVMQHQLLKPIYESLQKKGHPCECG